MQTILGANGTVAKELTPLLVSKGKRVRLVSRNAHPTAGVNDVRQADVTDLNQTIEAVRGSSVVYLLVGLKYDTKIWQEQWTTIMRNVIEACKRSQAKLVFYDNVYAYGKVEGVMTEETQFNPSSKKGEVRVKVATMLLDEMKSGALRAAILRVADFYGPDVHNSFLNVMVFEPLARGKKATWMMDEKTKHSFSFTPDTAKALAVLAENEKSFGHTWHAPTASPAQTGKHYIELIAQAFGVAPKATTMGRAVIKVGGLFNPMARESVEMLYQNEFDYVFDSSKFENTFTIKPTPYEEGIRLTAASYK